MTHSETKPEPESANSELNPWPALFALCLGFFMILVDSTIVTVATPAIVEDLHAGVNEVVWVTSAYLLAYAVPILITGRLGDHFGQRGLYLTGLTIFTLASLWCGFTSSIEMLIAARAVQGFGASMMTPQTMAIITRIFPAERRGRAMSLWGATAGVATLVGPILGGVLIDSLGWEWIFFINVPVGIFGLVLAMRLVPHLSTHPHQLDWLGVILSGLGLFCLVFGIQEGHQYDWGTIAGPISVWGLISLGLLLIALFLIWQWRNQNEPLLPLSLFRDRNFSLANIGITTMSLAITAMGFPFMIYAQLVRGMTPTEAALLFAPMALVSIVLADPVGKWTDRIHPRLLAGFGYATVALAFFWQTRVMTPGAETWELVLPLTLLGLGSAFVWAPTSTTANRNLPLTQAGAGAGVYNANRQVGAVIGSAAIAVLMDARLSAAGINFTPNEAGVVTQLPQEILKPFSLAMSESMLLCSGVMLISLVAVLGFQQARHLLAPQIGG
ncbi:MAG TPA: DHA2 family efflux MFS transporter permease subunit [Marmoricola sp.]|nr:DHA2 family efflux MFS transporter permease subunit [Marmoricola sp.]